ncbi:Peroxin-3 [Dichotomocladium elegans]|nr:Peroxin-3 [Dichotomocladium elegans]
MPFLQSIRDYTKRHRKGLLVTAAIGGGSYLLGRYATEKLRERQEKALSERVAKENLKRRFQQNQNDCVFTVLSLLPTLGDQLLNDMNLEAAWAKLQESRKLEKLEERKKKERAAAEAAKAEAEAAKIEHELEPQQQQQQQPPLDQSVGSLEASTASMVMVEDEKLAAVPGILDKKAKIELWEEIKTMSFVRTLTSIYSATLLTLLTHVQLNLLGRYTYVRSVSVLNQSEPTIRLQHADQDVEGGFLHSPTEHMFLSATWWILHRGWRLCAERVKRAVDEIISSIPLKRVISYQDAERILQQLRQRIEHEEDGFTPFNCGAWMLPETESEIQEYLLQAGFSDDYPNSEATRGLRKLLDEAKDYIDSPDFSSVLTSCLDEVFAIFDHQAFAKTLGPMEFSGAWIQEVEKDDKQEAPKKVTLANLLPSISRQAHLVIAGNEYLNAFAYIKELQALSAMIYTNYGDELTQ